MKNEMMIFTKEEFGRVTVLEKDGDIWFVASEIATILEYSEASAMTRHLDSDEKGLSNVQTLGGEQVVTIINESGLYSAILRSRKPEAKAFKKWVTSEVLPSIRKTGGYTHTQTKELTHFEKEVLAIKYAAEILNMSEVSRLGMVQKLFDLKGFDNRVLPAYVEKSRLTFSATKLLEDRGKPISAVMLNKLLLKEGYIEEKTRKSTSSATGYKTFKALSTKGLQYGENLASPKNDKEVHPHYYEDTFDELLSLLTGE